MIPSFTVPPLPQRRFSSPANAFRAASSPGAPVTTVTVFPPRPFVSRRTRTIPSPASRVPCFPQLHEETALPHPGQIRPFSDDQTSTVFDEPPFFNAFSNVVKRLSKNGIYSRKDAKAAKKFKIVTDIESQTKRVNS